VLREVVHRSAITVLHLHGRDIFFDLAGEGGYPVDAVSWHDRETAPGLAQARRLTPRAFLTGLDRELLGRGPRKAIKAQVAETLSQAGSRGLILAPSCVIPTTTPAEHLQAVVTALRG
jgi:uroporphyrinogen decarboxylase